MHVCHLSKHIATFVLCLSILACSATRATAVTQHFSSQGFIDRFNIPYPIKYRAGKNEQGESIAIEYKFKKTGRDQHYVIQLQFSKSGALLVASDYMDAFKKSKSSKNPAQHKMNFPAIGYRARYTFLGAGPGGMAEQLIFTSTDGKHDIKIISSHLLPDSVKLKPIELEKMARYVERVLLNIK